MATQQYVYPRWTLRGWFLAIAIVALVLSHFYVSVQNSNLRMTNYFLKRRNGFPQGDNPRLIQAAEVPMPHPCQWRFRVIVPTGRRLNLHVAFKDIPGKGLPASIETKWFPYRNDQPMELILDAYVFHEEGKAYLWCAFEDEYPPRQQVFPQPTPILLPADHFLQRSLPRTSVKSWIAPSIQDGPMTRSEGGITTYGWDSISEVAGKPMVLLRWQANGQRNGPRDGLMIWLEDAPPPTDGSK